METSDQPYLSFSAIYKSLGMERHSFKDQVQSSWQWLEMLSDLGLVPGVNPRSRGEGKRFTGVVRVAEPLATA